jgi:hypothetical protein
MGFPELCSLLQTHQIFAGDFSRHLNFSGSIYTYYLLMKDHSGNLEWFGTMDPLNCYWPSPAHSFLALGLIEIHDQDFCFLIDMCVFTSGAYSPTRGGCRSFYVGATFVAPLYSLNDCQIAAGSSQHSDTRHQEPRDSWPYFTASLLWEPSHTRVNSWHLYG